MLSDAKIRAARPGEKPIRLFDGGGLYLEVSPAGGKLWRLKYRYEKKEKRLGLGQYPAVGLKEARDRRDAARRLLAKGIDPSAQRKAQAAAQAAEADSFETVARGWFIQYLDTLDQGHKRKVVQRFDRHIFPYLGERPVADIKAPEVLELVRRIEPRALETAHRALQGIGQVIRYAIATGRADADPTPALRGALRPMVRKHMAAPTDPKAVGDLLRAVEGYEGGVVVGAALRLLPLVFTRVGELRTARWEQIDFDVSEWRYTASKTKTEHLVPLSRQAVAILKELHPLTGHLAGGFVFPGGRTSLRPMSNMAINAAYRRLGIDTRTELTGHGWRATARTLLHERLGFAPDVIEHQLAHRVPGALGRAYNRTKFLNERKAMMQTWADYLDSLREQCAG